MIVFADIQMMNISEYIRLMHKAIVRSDHEKGNYQPDVNEWKLFLNGHVTTGDSLDYAYNKYRCRMKYFSLGKSIILNILCFFPWLFSLPLTLLSHRKNTKVTDLLVVEEDIDVSYIDIFPDDFYSLYDNITFEKNYNRYFGFLAKDFAEIYIRCIVQFPFKFYFLYIIYKEFLAHSYFIAKYNPSAVAVYVNERKIATPLITEVYEQEGRKFISFMHGEYLLQLVQAYSCFSEYYVWDDMYIDMFKNDLRWKVGKYIVYKPKKLQKKWELTNDNPDYDYTYYLCDANSELIDDVTEAMNLLTKRGFKCKIRPHPREKEFNKYLIEKSGNVVIENIESTTLEESFRNTRFVVGLKSTSLYEAFAEGKPIVIDDVSSQQRYEGLKERKCRLLTMNHQLLSKVLSE